MWKWRVQPIYFLILRLIFWFPYVHVIKHICHPSIYLQSVGIAFFFPIPQIPRMTLILNIGLPCKQFYGCSWSCHTETPLEVWDDFVIVMEIKHQRCAIYLPLRTTHKSTSLLTPEALARPQSILSRAAMPSSGCNIFNNNIGGGMMRLKMVF